MNSERKAANAVEGLTVRACDNCLRRRARWFCAADDAFLCQGCDASVHSANQLARRHERVRLETASFKTKNKLTEHSSPAWHRGFTRKARTPRQSKRFSGQLQPKKDDEDTIMNLSPFPLVPEIGSEEGSQLHETEGQLLYRVPVFDPFAGKLCDISNETENIQADEEVEALLGNEINVLLSDRVQDDQGGACGLDNLQKFVSSETELAEFAADVESLLGKGLHEDSSGFELGLGLMGSKEDVEERRVKLEDEEVEAVIACHLDPALDKAREGFDWNFDYGSPVGLEKEEEQKMEPNSMETMAKANSKYAAEMRGKRLLRLNYEEVITAWSSHSQGSPWTTGARPDFNFDDCWPDFMCTHSTGFHGPNRGFEGRMAGGEEAREARVLRYREKRRTRLFSKKIRYEVRKLNAEKRPRMKGRFVKRTVFAGRPAFPYMMNK